MEYTFKHGELCEIINHPAVGEEIVAEPNPDYVPATEGYYETIENPDYVPATEDHYETIENPDYTPATPETPAKFMKWNWTGGPVDHAPAAPGGTSDYGWHQVGTTSDSKGAEAGVVHKGNGKASYFYYEQVAEAVPGTEAVGEPTIEVLIEGTPAVGEPTIEQWVDGSPAAGEEFIEVPNPDHVPAWTEKLCQQGGGHIFPDTGGDIVDPVDKDTIAPLCEPTAIFTDQCWLVVPTAPLDEVCEEQPNFWECYMLTPTEAPSQPGPLATEVVAHTSTPAISHHATTDELAVTGMEPLGAMASSAGIMLVGAGLAAVALSKRQRARRK